MAKVKNTSLKPILLRAGGKTITVAFDTVEVGDIKKLRKNKIINSYFKDGILVAVKDDDKKDGGQKSDERIALEEQATELEINFPANIGDDTLQAKIDEALAKD